MMKRTTAIAIACAAIAYTGILIHAQQQGPTVKRTVLLQHDTSAPGFEAVLVAVEIPVGGREGRHTHSGTAMIHVLEGANLFMDAEDEELAILDVFGASPDEQRLACQAKLRPIAGKIRVRAENEE